MRYIITDIEIQGDWDVSERGDRGLH